jgi:hypothetical protein
MSTYQVIEAVDETLKTLLWSLMQHDSDITSIISSEQLISLDPPFKLVKETEPEQNYLSLYLYRIVESAENKNRPLELRDSTALQYPPLCLNLFYLVTPITKSTENDHKLLGKAMSILYDKAIVEDPGLEGVLAGSTEGLRIMLEPISFEDMTKLWSAFMRSYRLSVSYAVKVAYIDSGREIETERVRRKRIEYSQIEG